MAIMNSFVIYRYNNLGNVNDQNKKRDSFYKFKQLLADRLLNKERNPKCKRIEQQHFLIKTKNSLKCKNCNDMYKKRSETILKCNSCLVALCIYCFPIYAQFLV